MTTLPFCQSGAQTCTKHYICAAAHTGRTLGAFFIAITLASTFPLTAHASVEGSDLIVGSSVDERALSAEKCPNIEATSAVLMDESGTVWFGRQATEQTQIASLTKIMTALVSIDYLNAEDIVVVSPQAASIKEASAGVLQGDEMTFEAALRATLTASGNDAATAVAEAAGFRLLAAQGVSGSAIDCQAAFVEAMNAKAVELGLANSYFTNPHGLDFNAFAQGQYGCAQDVATTLKHAVKNDLIRANMGYSDTSISVNRGGYSVELPLHNTDTLLYEYPGTCAAKTGFTAAAGPCVASAVSRENGVEYYVIVLNSTSKPQRFTDSQTLYDWIFTHRDAITPPPAPVVVPEAPKPEGINYQLITTQHTQRATINNTNAVYPLVANVAHLDWTHKTVPAIVRESNKTVMTMDTETPIEQEVSYNKLTGDIASGSTVGQVAFKQGNTLLWTTDLLAATDVAAPTWWEAAGIWIERTFSGLTGAATEAPNEYLNLEPIKIP